MTVSSRAYQHPQDFARLVTFLSCVRADVQHAHYLHSGDLTWQMFHMLADYPPAELVRIWQTADARLLGFVLVYPPFGFFDVQLDPQHRGGTLEADMLAWAEQQLRAASTLYTLVNNHDSARQAVLIVHGYQPDGDWRYLECSLTNQLPQPVVPPGFTVRSVAGEHEAAARAAVLAAAFGAPPQPARYQQFMRAPGYIPDLDVVAVAPDQRFAAFAMGWVDPTTHIGQFEPVGTAPAFRQQGIAQAVLYEGLHRMRQCGTSRAIVIVDAAEEAAGRLYESVGFVEQWQLTLYTKRLTIS